MLCRSILCCFLVLVCANAEPKNYVISDRDSGVAIAFDTNGKTIQTYNPNLFYPPKKVYTQAGAIAVKEPFLYMIIQHDACGSNDSCVLRYNLKNGGKPQVFVPPSVYGDIRSLAIGKDELIYVGNSTALMRFVDAGYLLDICASFSSNYAPIGDYLVQGRREMYLNFGGFGDNGILSIEPDSGRIGLYVSSKESNNFLNRAAGSAIGFDDKLYVTSDNYAAVLRYHFNRTLENVFVPRSVLDGKFPTDIVFSDVAQNMMLVVTENKVLNFNAANGHYVGVFGNLPFNSPRHITSYGRK